MEEIKYIALGLENVEVIVININDVNFMRIDGVYENHYIDQYTSTKEFRKMKYCKSLRLSLNPRANKFYHEYGASLYEDAKAFERLLLFNDLVDVTYMDKDKNHIESIYLPWDFNYSDNVNAFQVTKLDKKGNLEIIVNQKNKHPKKIKTNELLRRR